MTNKNGATTKVKLNFNFEAVDDATDRRLTKDETRNGDNLLLLWDRTQISTGKGNWREVTNPLTGKTTKEKFTGHIAAVPNIISVREDLGQYYGSPATAFHEVMHLFGLRDWYETKADKEAVGYNDIMVYPDSKNPIMHQIHWNNWKDVIEKQRKEQNASGDFIINRSAEIK